MSVVIKQWYNDDGILHRTDGPARILRSRKEWYINGKRHRVDGPAIIWKCGDQEWFVNGYRHREDGPAVIRLNGNNEWWVNGKRHREDGPAIKWDGKHEYYVNDKNITKEVLKWMQTHAITWPWNEETQAQFVLTFC